MVLRAFGCIISVLCFLPTIWYLSRYIDEQMYRWNTREEKASYRFHDMFSKAYKHFDYNDVLFGFYDLAFDDALKPYIDKLNSARGLIDCQQAFKLAKQLQQECAEFARLSQNQTYWNLSHRACVIAWLKACVLYVANGQQWEKSIEDFIVWSLRYDMWCKMVFFGADIERAERGEDSNLNKRGPRNLLEMLPNEFTLNDAKRVRQQEGLSNQDKKCENMIRQWVHRNYVLRVTDDSFVKATKA